MLDIGRPSLVEGWKQKAEKGKHSTFNIQRPTSKGNKLNVEGKKQKS